MIVGRSSRPQRRVACTVVTRSHLARARVLEDSLRKTNPQVELIVLLVDDPDHVWPCMTETFRVVRPNALLPADELADRVSSYGPAELANSLKPELLRYLLDECATSVVYLDSDVLLLRGIDQLWANAESHGIVLTPHSVKELPPNSQFIGHEDTVLSGGIMNAGVVAIADGGRAFVEWWSSRLKRECVDDPARHRYFDQRWLDLAIGYFDPFIEPDPGINVAWWNLVSRPVTKSADGGLLADGSPLRLFHFAGFDASAPHRVTMHWGTLPRIDVASYPALIDLCVEYAAQLLSQGERSLSTVPYGYGRLPSGMPLDSVMRRAVRSALLRWDRGEGPRPPDPFHDEGAFVDWLLKPTTCSHTACEFVARYIAAALETIVEGGAPIVPEAVRQDPVGWACTDGVQVHGLSAALLFGRVLCER